MNRATLYRAESDEIAVRYVAKTGAKKLAVRINGQELEFSDSEISVQDTEIGHLVVVTTSSLPDASESLLAVIAPPVNLQAPEVPIRLMVVEVTRWTSFTGAQGVSGPLFTYFPHKMDGMASASDD